MTDTPCIGNDPFCPCQDGDLCHYKDSPDGKTKAMAAMSDTTDLVRRLREYDLESGEWPPVNEAADMIERLSAPAEPFWFAIEKETMRLVEVAKGTPGAFAFDLRHPDAPIICQPAAPAPDRTERGIAQSKLLGTNVGALVDSGLDFVDALDATLKVYDHPAAPAPDAATVDLPAHWITWAQVAGEADLDQIKEYAEEYARAAVERVIADHKAIEEAAGLYAKSLRERAERAEAMKEGK